MAALLTLGVGVVANGLSPDDLEKVISAVQARQGRREQLALRVGERFILVQADEVIHASLVDEAILVVTNTVSGTSNYRTLDELSARLDPAGLVPPQVVLPPLDRVGGGEGRQKAKDSCGACSREEASVHRPLH